ncbi:MAG: outer membrane lipoprotein-sorting protein [Desulfuromonas sp.]|nr:MAG: outer membrane lipoprotein-sorting protein [Desulfuromonas sp.]
MLSPAIKYTLFLLLLSLALPSPSPALDLPALIREVETRYQGVSSHALVTMEIETAHWKRTLRLESWSEGRDRFLARILEPAKEKGVATLKIENEVWNYLPKVDRVMKIPPSMMGGAWMGSHLTNDDLVKANRIDEDYTFELLEEDDAGWLIKALPRPDAPVVWGKLVYRINRTPLVPVQISYFDEEMIEIRQIHFDQVEQVGDRWIPMRMLVKPLEKAEQTLLLYQNIEFDLSLPQRLFSVRSLKRK